VLARSFSTVDAPPRFSRRPPKKSMPAAQKVARCARDGNCASASGEAAAMAATSPVPGRRHCAFLFRCRETPGNQPGGPGPSGGSAVLHIPCQAHLGQQQKYPGFGRFSRSSFSRCVAFFLNRSVELKQNKESYSPIRKRPAGKAVGRPLSQFD
jgi:hypothetical protein